MNWIRVGVDQTGAVRKVRGELRAVPLPAAFVWTEGEVLRLELAEISALSLRELDSFLKPDQARRRYLVLLDCVLGLAECCFPLPGGQETFSHDLFLEAGRRAGYGRAVAESFFADLRPDGELPIRAVERRVGANSVFLTRPYQKNIQTGTFRIWKDLGRSLREEGKWFRLWPHEALSASGELDVGAVAWLAEGYPSWIWKNVFGTRHRDPAALVEALRMLRRKNQLRISSAALERLSRSQDWADAAALALFAGMSSESVSLTRAEARRLAREGWIYGQRWSPLFG